jgi:hypothetical protein
MALLQKGWLCWRPGRARTHTGPALGPEKNLGHTSSDSRSRKRLELPLSCCCSQFAMLSMRHLLPALLFPLALAGPVSGQATSTDDVNWNQKIEVASGGGYRGPWRMNESDYDYVDDPTVGLSEHGSIAVAWADQSRKDIFIQIYQEGDKKRFQAPVNVSRSPQTFSWLPRLICSPKGAGDVYLLWQEIVFSGGSHGGEIFFARSIDGGKSFSEPLNLSNTMAGDGKGRLTRERWDNGSLDLAMGPEGNLYAAWTDYEGRLWISRSSDQASFSKPLLIAGNGAEPTRGPSLAVDPLGVVHVAWTVGEDPAADIHFASSKDAARSFGIPQVALKSEGHSDAPKIAVDSEGTLHLVYAESLAGPFAQYHIRYSRLHDGAPQFEWPREISDPGAQPFDSASFPALSLSSGNVFVTWEIFHGRGGRPQGLGFAHSRDGGRSFASTKTVPNSLDPVSGFNGSQQGLLMKKLASNPKGALAVVNSTFKANQFSRIWLFRGATGR